MGRRPTLTGFDLGRPSGDDRSALVAVRIGADHEVADIQFIELDDAEWASVERQMQQIRDLQEEWFAVFGFPPAGASRPAEVITDPTDRRGIDARRIGEKHGDPHSG